MILVIHIVVAVMSLAVSAYSAFRPAQRAVTASYAMIGATLATGVGLITLGDTSLVHACVSGIAFLATSTALALVARARLHARLAD